MKETPTCPRCGSEKLVVRTSKRIGSMIEARRECKDKTTCGYRDVARMKPSEIISIQLL